MMRHRPYIYVEASDGVPSWWLSGVLTREFLQEHGDASLLLLKHQFGLAGRHSGTGLDYVPLEGLDRFREDDHYSYGDLVLLDLPDISRLDALPGQTVAELLYLAHAWEPLSTPFFPQLGNQFAYLCHDDGWIAKVYLQQPDRFLAALGGVLAARLARIHRRRVRPPAAGLYGSLGEWTARGLLIDLTESRKTAGELHVPLHIIREGHNPLSQSGRGIDDLLNNMEEYKADSQRFVLHYRRHQWALDL